MGAGRRRALQPLLRLERHARQAAPFWPRLPAGISVAALSATCRAKHGTSGTTQRRPQMTRVLMLIVLVGMMLCPRGSHANLLLFQAQLIGAEEVPPTGSTATGFGSVLLNDVALT